MTLARHQFTVTDQAGNILPGAHVEVRTEIPGAPLAALKEFRDGTGPMTNPFDTDADGFAGFFVVGGAYKIRVYTGPTGAPTSEQIFRYVAIGLNAEGDGIGVPTQRVFSDAGDLTVAADDVDEIYINKTIAAPTTVHLPSAALRTKSIKIIDGKGDAATNNILILPLAGQKIYETVDYAAVIDGNGGSLKLTPRQDTGTGYS